MPRSHPRTRPTCRADIFLFNKARGVSATADPEATEDAAQLLVQKLTVSQLPACVKFAEEGASKAQAMHCFRMADRGADDRISEAEFTAWFHCMRVPFACLGYVCA